VFTQSVVVVVVVVVETTIAMLRRAMLSCAYACTKQSLIQSGLYDLVCDVLVAVCIHVSTASSTHASASSISLAVAATTTTTKRLACTYGSINNMNREDIGPSIKKGLALATTTTTTTAATTLPGHRP